MLVLTIARSHIEMEQTAVSRLIDSSSWFTVLLKAQTARVSYLTMTFEQLISHHVF